MTNVFTYDFAPTRSPPINLPVLNLPGSFDFGNLAYQGGALINWASANWVDLAVVAFAAYGALIGIPRLITLSGNWLRSSKSATKKWLG